MFKKKIAKDSVELISEEEGVTLPSIRLKISLTNISDSSFVIFPKQSHFLITYRFDGTSYETKMPFSIFKSPDINYISSKKYLLPDENITLITQGFLIELGSDLDHKIQSQNDNTYFLLRILPTFKCAYKGPNDLYIELKNVFDVQLK